MFFAASLTQRSVRRSIPAALMVKTWEIFLKIKIGGFVLLPFIHIWPGFHTLDVEMAIDDLKEIYEVLRGKNGI